VLAPLLLFSLALAVPLLLSLRLTRQTQRRQSCGYCWQIVTVCFPEMQLNFPRGFQSCVLDWIFHRGIISQFNEVPE
jgi:hypothetical protein